MNKNMCENNKLSSSSSKYHGLCWNKIRKTWLVRIHFKGNRQYIGNYRSEIEAAIAYDKRAKELYGDDAILNFPNMDIPLPASSESSKAIRLTKKPKKKLIVDDLIVDDSIVNDSTINDSIVVNDKNKLRKKREREDNDDITSNGRLNNNITFQNHFKNNNNKQNDQSVIKFHHDENNKEISTFSSNIYLNLGSNVSQNNEFFQSMLLRNYKSNLLEKLIPLEYKTNSLSSSLFLDSRIYFPTQQNIQHPKYFYPIQSKNETMNLIHLPNKKQFIIPNRNWIDHYHIPFQYKKNIPNQFEYLISEPIQMQINPMTNNLNSNININNPIIQLESKWKNQL